MAVFAFLLVLAGSLETILEFGSVTFLLVSLLMAYANFKIRHLTDSSAILTIITTILGLIFGTALIFYYEFSAQRQQMYFIGGLYALLTLGSWLYSRGKVTCE
jgi:peptidoglycan/LPS O-acetylase OafA/YrhL